MTRPLDTADIDQAIRLYLAGKPLEEIDATTGVSRKRIARERSIRGIPARSNRVENLPAEQIAAAYLSGASEYALALQYGVSRGPITRIILSSGIERRGMAEAGVMRNAGMSESERKAQTSAANRAARMRRSPQIQKLRTALLRELTEQPQSGGEQHLASMIEARGLRTASQRAIGVYNVDIAALPVAVEVLGGGWHALKSVHAERTPYILDEGWHLVMIWDHEGSSALGPGAADYVVAFVEEMRRHPPATCQYRVITGQGQLLAARGREDNEFPLVPPPRRR